MRPFRFAAIAVWLENCPDLLTLPIHASMKVANPGFGQSNHGRLAIMNTISKQLRFSVMV